jgi:hypothetical protein
MLHVGDWQNMRDCNAFQIWKVKWTRLGGSAHTITPAVSAPFFNQWSDHHLSTLGA